MPASFSQRMQASDDRTRQSKFWDLQVHDYSLSSISSASTNGLLAGPCAQSKQRTSKTSFKLLMTCNLICSVSFSSIHCPYSFSSETWPEVEALWLANDPMAQLLASQIIIPANSISSNTKRRSLVFLLPVREYWQIIDHHTIDHSSVHQIAMPESQQEQL